MVLLFTRLRKGSLGVLPLGLLTPHPELLPVPPDARFPITVSGSVLGPEKTTQHNDSPTLPCIFKYLCSR